MTQEDEALAMAQAGAARPPRCSRCLTSSCRTGQSSRLRSRPGTTGAPLRSGTEQQRSAIPLLPLLISLPLDSPSHPAFTQCNVLYSFSPLACLPCLQPKPLYIRE